MILNEQDVRLNEYAARVHALFAVVKCVRLIFVVFIYTTVSKKPGKGVLLFKFGRE